MADRSAPGSHGFDVLGHFSHCFFKPYNITLDFTDMNVYIAPRQGRLTGEVHDSICRR